MGFFNKDFDETEKIDEVQAEVQETAEEEFHEEVELSHEEEIDREANMVAEDEKRELRRKRRKRTELLVTLTAAMAVVMLCGGVFAGVSAIRQFANTREESVATETTEDIQEIVQEILASETELPTEIVDVVTPEELLDEYIDTVIAGMTINEKVAGLIITSPEELTGVNLATRAGDGTKTAIEAMPVGGLVYYRRNMQSKDQFSEMLTNTKNYSKFPIFLAVNEGGDRNSSVQNSPISVPDVKEPGEVTTGQEAYELATVIGDYLTELNFNVNFAPTADILHTEGAAVSDYCFGGGADFNAEMVAEYVRGMEEKGISAALKTFPGTGYLRNSTTDSTVSTDKTRSDFEDDFQVFKAGIDAGVDFVMVSNIVASELSGGMDPCSMSSSVVTDILRNELGFAGIIITEPMNGKAITEYYSASEAAVAALKAGCDMILLPESLDEAYQGILEGLANGSVAEARINDSLKRVMRVKYAYKLDEFAN